MNFLFTLLSPLLGFITRACYSIVGNVGVSIILFTLIVKVLMFPLSIKQQKNTAKSQIFAPRVREIQTRYRNNQAKMQEEMMKLQKEGYNPTNGCLSMVLTMLILFGVLGVVYKPLTYFEHIPETEIEQLREIALESNLDSYITGLENLENKEIIKADTKIFFTEKDVKKRKTDATEKALNTFKEQNENATDEEIKAFENEFAAQYSFLESEHLSLTNLQSELRVVNAYKQNPASFSEMNSDTIKTLDTISDSIVFMGIDFSQMPSIVFDDDVPFFSLILIIPILSFVFAMGQTIITQIIQRKSSPESVDQMGSMKYMMYFMPVMSLVIAFQFPAGAGFYWALSSAIGIAQTLLIHKLYPPEKIRAEIKEKYDSLNLKPDNVVVIEKSDGEKSTKKESEMSASERKEYYRKKLEEARKADLEKYGEVGENNTDSKNTKE